MLSISATPAGLGKSASFAARPACRKAAAGRSLRAPVRASSTKKPTDDAALPSPPPSKPGPMDHLVQFLYKGYQPEFHVANFVLLFTEHGLTRFGQMAQPVESAKCLEHPTYLGCLYTSETKPFPDEVGFAMFLVGLAYTGFIAALAVKNYKRCKNNLLENGFTAEELDGVTTYMVVRYAELMVEKGMLDEAKAYIAKIKYECGYFIDFSDKEYVPPYAKWLPGDGEKKRGGEAPAAASLKSNAVRFKRAPTPGKKTPGGERKGEKKVGV